MSIKENDTEKVFSSVDHAIQRDWITTGSFRDIQDGNLCRRKQIKILTFNFLLVIFTIRHLVGLVAEDQSPWHLYVLNPFLGFGIFNRFTSSLYIFGYVMNALHSLTTLWAEREGKLTPISGLRTMYNKLGILS